MVQAQSGEGKPRLSTRVYTLLAERLERFLADPAAAISARKSSAAALPTAQVEQLEAVLVHSSLSYREASAIQAAYGLLEPGLDLTRRHGGARSVAAKFAALLRDNHIAATLDAFQNIGKNSVNLCRGNVSEFDALLKWASSAGPPEIEAALDYAVAMLALSARPVTPMPELDVPALTFYRVALLLDDLLARKSGGAYDQFAAAAFLHALIEEVGTGGVGGLRVDTKHIHASDASAGTASDVEVRLGGRVEEALEVSGNDWRHKLGQAVQAIRTADLPRSHVVASVHERLVSEMHELAELDADVSVLETKSFVRVLIAALRKPARRQALVRLHELLDRNQPNVGLVNDYVDLLKQHGLTA